MLLKYSQSEKRSKINGSTRQRGGTGNMKLIAGGSAVNARLPRKTVRGFASKRPSSHLRPLAGTGREEHRTPIDASDNSNDSGLGFDQHLDVAAVHAVLRISERESAWDSEHPQAKRKKLEIKLESDDANDNFSFSRVMSKSLKASSQTGGLVPECLMPSRGNPGGSGMQRPLGGSVENGGSSGNGNTGSTSRGSLSRLPPRPIGVSSRRAPGPVPLSSPLAGLSSDSRVQLQIASQPEQQHRARYQTEGSRGAVKDRSGNGFPIVKLVGYTKPATLQVFIGTDMGRVAPHMFYQACKVSGKNSTPCVEKKIDGTVVIEVEFDPAKDMTVICDCVGILKERNVDVEHRFPDQSETRNKKKSTRCRMVFRTTITLPDGSTEILQTTSQPIVCTQPPGVPEICKKSLNSASCVGGMELFILGKNFLKDTQVVFQLNDVDPTWKASVTPDKEYLQQTHLVCIVPPYQRCDIFEPVNVRLFVTSSGKTSEPHTFTYTPVTSPVLQPAVGTSDIPHTCLNLVSSGVTPGCVDLNRVFSKPPLGPPAGLILPRTPTKSPSALLPGVSNQFLSIDPSSVGIKKDTHSVRLWSSMPLAGDSAKPEDMKARDEEQSKVLGPKVMPPPPLLPITALRASSNLLMMPHTQSVVPSSGFKTEALDESSQESAQLSPEDLKGMDLRMKRVSSVGTIATVSDLLSTQSPSLATFRQFVSNPSDAPLPTQSGQSVEKYLSHIENPISVKVGDAGGQNSDRSVSAVVVGGVAVTATGVSGSASASRSVNQSDSSVQELPKLCNAEVGIASQFNSSIIFGPSQAPNNNILTAGLSTTGSETQKISFVNDITLPTIYNSSVANKEQLKPQLVDQPVLQDNMAPRLLAVGLNTVASANQSKSKYQENALSDLCPNQNLSPTLLPPVTDSTISNFSTSSNSESSSLNVSTILSNLTDTQDVIRPSSSLIYCNSEQQASKRLLSSAESNQKSDESIIDNSGKLCSHSSSTPPSSSSSSSSVGVLGSSHDLLSSSATSVERATLNMSTEPSAIGRNLLPSVTEAESNMINGTSDSRLDALVSSAIESHILGTNCQTQGTEKLNVFSSSESLMTAVPSENSILNSQTQPILNDSLGTNQTSSSPIHVQEMSLNSAMPVPSVNSFTLNALSNTQAPVQITQENLILSNTVTAAFNSHILNSSNSAKVTEASLTLNPGQESSLSLQPVVSGDTHIVLSNSTCTPPIAVKSIIMGSSNANANNMLNCVNPNSHLSGKSLISPESIGGSNECILTNNTSPIAMKTMMLTAPSEMSKSSVMSTAMDVKDILAPAAGKEEMPLPTTNPHCTSPIAVKKIILGSTSVGNNIHSDSTLPTTTPHCTSPIAMKKMILESASVGNNIHSDSTLPTTSPHCTSPIAMKKMILESASVGNNIHPDSTLTNANPHCTSPIAVKKMILESSSVASNMHSDSTINVNSVLNTQPTHNMIESTQHVSLSTEKLDALVESTMSKHILASSQLQSSPSTTSSINIQGGVCASNNSLPLTSQSLANILSIPSTLSNSPSLDGPSSSLITESERELHNSVTSNTIESSNVSLPSQAVRDGSSGILPSPSQTVPEPSLMTMYSSDNATTTKTQTLESVPAVSNCPNLLNHHLTMFGQQPVVPVHSLLSTNESTTNPSTIGHSISFSSTTSNTSGLIANASCTLASKIGEVTSSEQGQAQVRLLNEVLMNLASADGEKTQMTAVVSQESKVNKEMDNSKYVVTGGECKIVDTSKLESSSSAVSSVEAQTAHLQQQQNLQMMQQQQPQTIQETEKQMKEKEQMVSSSPLPVPINDISSVRQTTKDPISVVQGPAQKKMEEGMVPQELTQMSESDLLSYINPSCFDQV